MTRPSTERNAYDRSSLIELQRMLLPPALPPIGCTEAAAHYRVHNDAFRLGGDWYDLIDRPDNRVVAIIGDVVGHGAQQISVMGQLRAASNALGRTLDDPADILSALDAFAIDVPGAAYASVAILMLDGTTTARLAVAGHPPLLHVRARGGHSLIELGRGPLLGIPGTRTTDTFEYEIDDVLLLYTDGLTDRRGVDPLLLMEEVAQFVRQRLDAPCQSIATGVIDEFARAADDDVVVLALRPRNHRSPEYLLQPQLAPTITFD
jgi:serine phosphatase RsbU (regulator of sigma subunit)